MNNANVKFKSGVFLTFSGNCKEALSFYKTCFGGTLRVEVLERKLPGYAETPVINGSLVSDYIVIHGSDLVYNEGRVIGNYMAILINCANKDVRKELVKKLAANEVDSSTGNENDQLIEIIDAFDVRWILCL